MLLVLMSNLGKQNSIGGVQKKHSICKEFIPFLETILTNTPVKRIGTKKIVRTHYRSEDPIQIREFGTYGRQNYILVRAFAKEAMQDLYLYCKARDFEDVVHEINRYCGNLD